jgi:hypothetical protein
MWTEMLAKSNAKNFFHFVFLPKDEHCKTVAISTAHTNGIIV